METERTEETSAHVIIREALNQSRQDSARDPSDIIYEALGEAGFLDLDAINNADDERSPIVQILVPPATKVTLRSGITIANFSSPHPFRFTTGEELPGCDAERSHIIMLEAVESTVPGIR